MNKKIITTSIILLSLIGSVPYFQDTKGMSVIDNKMDGNFENKDNLLTNKNEIVNGSQLESAIKEFKETDNKLAIKIIIMDKSERTVYDIESLTTGKPLEPINCISFSNKDNCYYATNDLVFLDNATEVPVKIDTRELTRYKHYLIKDKETGEVVGICLEKI